MTTLARVMLESCCSPGGGRMILARSLGFGRSCAGVDDDGDDDDVDDDDDDDSDGDDDDGDVVQV